MPAAAERQDLGSLRAEVHRKLAAQLDVGEPAAPIPAAPPPPSFAAAPEPAPAPVRKVETRSSRQRMENLRAEAQRNSITRLDKPSLTRFLPAGRGHRGFSSARLLLVVVALAAGGMAAFLALQHDPTAATAAVPAHVVEAQAKPVMGKILVAKAAIDVGQPLTPASVEWADWPVAQLRPDYLTFETTPTAPTELAGSMARYQLFPGEPIEKLQLAPAGSSYLSAILGKGMRAVSVSVDADSASGGFISPNDHVDVMLTRAASASHDAQTILTNVKVLAINARLGSDGSPSGSADAKADVFTGQAIATLELDPVQGDVITEAALVGKLSLVLRPSGEAAAPALAEERAVNAAIRLTSPFWTASSAPTSLPPAPQTLH